MTAGRVFVESSQNVSSRHLVHTTSMNCSCYHHDIASATARHQYCQQNHLTQGRVLRHSNDYDSPITGIVQLPCDLLSSSYAGVDTACQHRDQYLVQILVGAGQSRCDVDVVRERSCSVKCDRRSNCPRCCVNCDVLVVYAELTTEYSRVMTTSPQNISLRWTNITARHLNMCTTYQCLIYTVHTLQSSSKFPDLSPHFKWLLTGHWPYTRTHFPWVSLTFPWPLLNSPTFQGFPGSHHASGHPKYKCRQPVKCHFYDKRESLANAKVSARQPW